MKLRLKPHKDNLYKKKAVFIKNASPLAWISELNNWSVQIDSLSCFVVKKEEETFGCLVVFKDENIVNNIKDNIFYQCEAHRFFVPLYSKIEPSVARNEWRHLLGDHTWFFHPETGIIILDEKINWEHFLENKLPSERSFLKPAKKIKIPNEVVSFSVELQEEDVLEKLNNMFTGEIPKDLPFDMKKLLNGNKVEMEKYLKYLETNPEKALSLGIPLNMSGASRNDFLGKYKFQQETWLTKFLAFFIKAKSEKSVSNSPKEMDFKESLSSGNSRFGGKSSSNNTSPKGIRFSPWLLAFFPILIVVRMIIANVMPSENPMNVRNVDAKLVDQTSFPVENVISTDSRYNKPNRFILDKADSIFDKRFANHNFKSEKASKKAKKKIKDSLIRFYEAKVEEQTKQIVKEQTPQAQRRIEERFGKTYKDNKEALQPFIDNRLAHLKKETTDSLTFLYGLKTARPKIIVGDLEQSNENGQSKTETAYNASNDNKSSNHFEINEFAPINQIPLWKIALIICVVFAVIAVFFTVKGQVKSVKNSYYEEHLSFGTGQNFIVKILYFFITLALIIYLIKPLIEVTSYGFFTFLIIFIVLLLLIRLLNNKKSILNDKKK